MPQVDDSTVFFVYMVEICSNGIKLDLATEYDFYQKQQAP